MASDVRDEGPAKGYDSDLQRFMFLLGGWVVCALRGQLAKYPDLVAQSDLETTRRTSNAWDKGSGGWCMHYSPTGTKRANGAWTTANGETLAVYFGFFRHVNMWADRLDWDGRKEIQFESAEQYRSAVIDRGGWLGFNAREDRKRAYKNSWKRCREELPGWVEFVSGTFLSIPWLLWPFIVWFMVWAIRKAMK